MSDRRWVLSFSHSLQGGGIRIDGSANLIDCNIHDNVAEDYVSFLASILNPYVTSHHRLDHFIFSL